jgi:hypothetical protein
MMPCAERLIGWAAAVISYLSLVLRARCGAAQQLRNLVPHRAVDNGGMLARVTDALVTDLMNISSVARSPQLGALAASLSEISGSRAVPWMY